MIIHLDAGLDDDGKTMQCYVLMSHRHPPHKIIRIYDVIDNLHRYEAEHTVTFKITKQQYQDLIDMEEIW